MAIYEHGQELKRAEQLVEPDKIGNCLTCRFWDVEQKRTEIMARHLSLCLEPQLEEHQLIVSGASGCNKWQRFYNIAEDAEDYMHRGEQVV